MAWLSATGDAEVGDNDLPPKACSDKPPVRGQLQEHPVPPGRSPGAAPGDQQGEDALEDRKFSKDSANTLGGSSCAGGDDEHSPAAEVLPPWESHRSEASRQNFGCGTPLFGARLQLPAQLLCDSAAQRHAFASAPLPAGGGSLKARIVRTHHGLLAGDRYTLYAELADGSLAMLCTAERQAAKRTGVRPYYAISSQLCDYKRASDHFLGRLQGNVLCTQYELHGPRQAKRKSGRHGCQGDLPREELAAVRFRKPGDAPRSVEIALPFVGADGARRESRPLSPRHEGLAAAWARSQQEPPPEEAGSDDSDGPGAARGAAPEPERWCRLVSLQPRWDDERQVYSMDFHGRVKRSSSKNFQLAAAGEDFKPLGAEPPMLMQFGRVEEDVFSVDVSFPLSPAQALAIALSMFDSRIAERLRMYY